MVGALAQSSGGSPLAEPQPKPWPPPPPWPPPMAVPAAVGILMMVLIFYVYMMMVVMIGIEFREGRRGWAVGALAQSSGGPPLAERPRSPKTSKDVPRTLQDGPRGPPGARGVVP